jgi:hypothetical protein
VDAAAGGLTASIAKRAYRAILASVLAALLAAGGPLLAGSQSGSTNEAGIYIDFGNGDQTMVVVPFSEPSISSIELLERSELPILTVQFGSLGDAVCLIEETGCDISACRSTLCQEGDRNAPFWQFVQQPEGGNWTVSPLGASSAQVEDGTIDAWIWTGETPDPPELSMDQMVNQTGFDDSDTPASFTTRVEQERDNRTSIIIGVALLTVAIVIGGGLVLGQRRKHATR